MKGFRSKRLKIKRFHSKRARKLMHNDFVGGIRDVLRGWSVEGAARKDVKLRRRQQREAALEVAAPREEE